MVLEAPTTNNLTTNNLAGRLGGLLGKAWSLVTGSRKFPCMDDPIRIGISSCLLGQEVRFDGGHKRDAFLVATLGRWVEWVPVCPELEARARDVPREAMRLLDRGGETRLVTTATGVDHTQAMRLCGRGARPARLAQLDLCGYVLKKDSPSCGMERVKLYRDGGGAPNAQRARPVRRRRCSTTSRNYR